MRLSSLSFAAIVALLFFLFSASTLLAQHGGGGGGGGGSSAGSSGGSSGGGSHGGGGGSGASSSGGGHSSGSHSSGASASHGAGSSGHSSSASNSSISSSARSNSERIRDITRVSLIEPIAAEPAKTTPQKRGFFSFLRHPLRKPEPAAVAEFQHPVCWHGVCRVCPVAQVPGAGGCVTPHIFLRNTYLCSRAEILGGACLQTHFLDDCSGLRAAMERQARRMQAAAAARQNACSGAFTQECADLTNTAQSEASLYQALQQKLSQCQARSRGPQAYRNGLTPFHDFSDFGVDMDRP
jgi:hypothetical protein